MRFVSAPSPAGSPPPPACGNQRNRPARAADFSSGIEADRVVVGHSFKGVGPGTKTINPAAPRCCHFLRIGTVTYRAVVVALVLNDSMSGSNQQSSCSFAKPWAMTQRGDHILMFVMRKLDIELFGTARIAKGKSCGVARRYFRVTDSADCRLRAFEELRAMTADTSVMTWIVSNVGKIPDLLPVRGGRFVACLAGFLMLFRRMRESRVVNGRIAPRLGWRTPGWSSSLPGGAVT